MSLSGVLREEGPFCHLLQSVLLDETEDVWSEHLAQLYDRYRFGFAFFFVAPLFIPDIHDFLVGQRGQL